MRTVLKKGLASKFVEKKHNRSIPVVSNSHGPYLTCKVNGLEKDIFPVYHTFMGVLLEESQNNVELEYCPPYWTFW